MKVQINHELVMKTQRAHVECDGLAYLLTYMTKNSIDQNSDQYKNYESRYFESFKAFEHSKSEVEAEIRKTISDPIGWTLDYETGMAEVEIK